MRIIFALSAIGLMTACASIPTEPLSQERLDQIEQRKLEREVIDLKSTFPSDTGLNWQ
jgi:hypothetical protein